MIWSETYKRPLAPRLILGLQSDVAVEIASKLGQPYGILKSKAANYSSTVHEPSLSSFDCILRAYAYRRNFKIELYGPARRCLEETVHRDPNYADAWAMLGWLRLDAVRFASSADGDTKDTLGEAFDAASRAVSLDNNNVMALQALSSIIFYMGQYAESEKIQRQALALNPNDPDTLAQLGWRLAVRGNWDEGIPLLQHAIDRTVNPPGWYYYLIAIHSYLEGAYADMLSEAEHSTGDGTGLGQSLIAIAQGALGNKDAARRALAKMAAISPLLARDPATVYRRHQATDEIVNALVAGLRKAGWSEPVTPAQ